MLHTLHTATFIYRFAFHIAGAHHWLCISYGEDDSLGLMMPVGSELVLQIASIYKYDGHILTMIFARQQVGLVECGLFAIVFAVEMCWQGSSGCVLRPKKMREHLYN